MISIDFTAFLFLLSFLAFLFLLDLLFFKPVFNNIKAREEKSGGAKEDIDELQAKIATRFKLLEADQTIAEAKIQANALITESRHKAGQIKDALVHSSVQELSASVEELLNAVEDDRQEILHSASEHINKISLAILDKLGSVMHSRDSHLTNKDHSLV